MPGYLQDGEFAYYLEVKLRHMSYEKSAKWSKDREADIDKNDKLNTACVGSLRNLVTLIWGKGRASVALDPLAEENLPPRPINVMYISTSMRATMQKEFMEHSRAKDWLRNNRPKIRCKWEVGGKKRSGKREVISHIRSPMRIARGDVAAKSYNLFEEEHNDARLDEMEKLEAAEDKDSMDVRY